jgi:hypothetical protein
MVRRSLLSLASSALCLITFGATDARAAEPYRITGPAVHDNLAVYFVHGESAPGRAPLTLQEAMARDAVRVHETGDVNQLAIENLSEEEIFVQSGDIVKGGKQDRVLMVSLVLPPRSGRVPIASFCVEQGRWAGRGREDAMRFSSSAATVPSLQAKRAMKAPAPARVSSAGMDTGERQRKVWRSVAATQSKLADRVGQPVASPVSNSSLQLALENEKLQDKIVAYVKALQAAGEKPSDVIGYAFAINGKLNSADVYPSNALFRKMWAKLLDASATEALGEKSDAAPAPPDVAAVQTFLQAAEQEQAAQKELTKSVQLETREAQGVLYFATVRKDGSWVHRNYLAK